MLTVSTAILIAVVLWFATGTYLNIQLKEIHSKSDRILDQLNGLREYLYEIDPQFDEERTLTRGLFESVESSSFSFDGISLHELEAAKRERGERTLNSGFSSNSIF